MGLWENLAACEVIDLSHPFHRGMPVSPNHPAFQMASMRRHGDLMRDDGGSAANEIIVTGGHVGTHIDALAHVSHNGLLHGGVDAVAAQSHDGFAELGVDEVEPILCRGVLLDVAALHGVDVLEPGYEVTVQDLERAAGSADVEVAEGDAVLIRTGWAKHWSNVELFRGQEQGAPGPGEEAARWLAERDVRLCGGETIAYEVVRAGAGHSVLPVHRVLLVEAGIHIVEVMDLRALAVTGLAEFTLLAIPLKILGATGSPIRPLALLGD